ncbi:response regulator [Azomonas macrocytogenes]|uniref:CheY-like chemotaxis protein n=1 Tax=Azomonas macrocytogenes TaxID=69962 RepID=A0A839T1S0_AZOMA|nr:response regulator [Azomonas macrocytogenes]MBB3103507.1 CheY-like chemotaxis protein [Azomonas macrocytogenes]
MRGLKRILHVEDVPSIQLITRIALEKVGGFEVLSCKSGQQALEQVQQFNPDLILLDVMLPEMDGVETLRKLGTRVNLREVPVVFLTGYLAPERFEELRQLGARAVINKPFDALQLPMRLQEIWKTATNRCTQS